MKKIILFMFILLSTWSFSESNIPTKEVESKYKFSLGFMTGYGNKLYQTVKNTVTELTIDNTNKTSKLPVDIKYAEKGKIRWYVDIPGTFTKNNKNRKVGIPDHLVERIRDYLWEREGELIKTKYKDALMHDENMNVIRADHTTAMNVFDEMPIIPFKYVDTSFNNLCYMAGLTDITIQCWH